MTGPSGIWTTTEVAVVHNASAIGEDEWSGDETTVTGDYRMQRGDDRRKKSLQSKKRPSKIPKGLRFSNL